MLSMPSAESEMPKCWIEYVCDNMCSKTCVSKLVHYIGNFSTKHMRGSTNPLSVCDIPLKNTYQDPNLNA